MKIYIINMPKDSDRRAYQKMQFEQLGLSYTIINATTTDDITEVFNRHKNDWERPLREVEVACYYSHRDLWEKIASSNEPAMIMEDDALLSKHLPDILSSIEKIQDIDYVNLEVVGRRKLISKEAIDLPLCDSKLYRLFLDRNGTGGYVIFPNGAQKLLALESMSGIGLADAHINRCGSLKAYQIEPAAVIQMDQCDKYGISSPIEATSNIGTVHKPIADSNTKIHFHLKRLRSQLSQGLIALRHLIGTQKREIALKKDDFDILRLEREV